jgi:hypothetical protein
MSSAKEKILILAGDHRQRLEKLLQVGPLLRGSFGRVFTRCGKPNCWCAQSKKGHPHTRMTWSQEGQMVTRRVPAPAAEKVLELTRNYRQFRFDRRTLLTLEAQIQRLLDRYEEALTNQVRRSFAFLDLNPKMSRPQGEGMQNQLKRKKRH